MSSESVYAPTDQGGQITNDLYASKPDLENFATLFLLIIMNLADASSKTLY